MVGELIFSIIISCFLSYCVAFVLRIFGGGRKNVLKKIEQRKFFIGVESPITETIDYPNAKLKTITIAEEGWPVIVIIIAFLLIIGNNWVETGYQNFEEIKKIENKELPVLIKKLSNPENPFRDVAPQPKWLKDVRIRIDNYDDRIGLDKKTVFRVTATTDLYVKEFNFVIFHVDESEHFTNSTKFVGDENNKTNCPLERNPKYSQFRVFRDTLVTGNEGRPSGFYTYSGNMGDVLKSPGTYYYYVGILTMECDLYTFTSSKPVVTVPSYFEELQILTNIAILEQATEAKKNNLAIQGFSKILIGAIPIGFAITFVTILLNVKRIRNE